MRQLFLVVTLIGFLTIGCSNTSDTTQQNGNKAVTGASPPPASATMPAPATPQDSQKSPVSAVEKTKGMQVDVTGAYFVQGKVPTEFSEIDYLALANIDENAKPSPLNGFIRPKRMSAKDYRLLNPKLSGNNLTFETDAVSGLSYGFDGTFLKMGNFPVNPPEWDKIVLQGTLRKMRGGNVIAETRVSLTYSAGG
jgi:hypothetical protein